MWMQAPVVAGSEVANSGEAPVGTLYRPVSLTPVGAHQRGDSMTIVEHKWSALPVPYAIEVTDRVRKERYYDPDFYAMEAELIWPRVWQMACRLEEIPEAGDFAEYQILDQSVIVIRTEDLGVRAFQNVCRHRGVRVAQGRGLAPRRFRLPVPWLVLRR